MQMFCHSPNASVQYSTFQTSHNNGKPLTKQWKMCAPSEGCKKKKKKDKGIHAARAGFT